MTDNHKALYAFTRTDTLYISGITELPNLHTFAKKKRFSFWLRRIGMANPIEYYFELTNPNAQPGTSIIDFIKGAKLTFFKFYSIII